MSRFTIYMDISGRVSRTTKDHQFIVVGGFSIETEKVEYARSNLPIRLLKWKDITKSDLDRSLKFMKDYSLHIASLCLDKNSNIWTEFWEDSDIYHSKLASISRERTGYVKAGNVIKYFLFGKCSCVLLAESIRRSGYPLILNGNGLGLVEACIVCDSDLQGDDNINVFKSCFEEVEKSQSKIKRQNLRIILKDVRIESEEDEPLLLVADHIAGICNTLFANGEKFAPRNLNVDYIRSEFDKIKRLGKVTLVKREFNLDYKEIFDNFFQLQM